MFRKPVYTVLSMKESTESSAALLNDAHFLRAERHSKLCKRLHWIIHVLACLIIGVMSIGLYSATQTSRTKCWDMFNYYSPVNEAVTSHSYVHQVFNGSLWNKNPFKGPPTEEVEKAWYDIYEIVFVASLNNAIVQLVYLTDPGIANKESGANFFQGSSILFSNWPAIEVGVGLLASNLPHLSFRMARAIRDCLPSALLSKFRHETPAHSNEPKIKRPSGQEAHQGQGEYEERTEREHVLWQDEASRGERMAISRSLGHSSGWSTDMIELREVGGSKIGEQAV